MDQVPGPHGEVILKATLSGFEKELTEGAAKLKHEAEDYFNAASGSIGTANDQLAALQKLLNGSPEGGAS